MALAKAGGPLDILLVEDNLADVRLTQEALKDSAVPHNLLVAEDGGSAMSILRTEGRRPDVILLDLGLPGTNGREVLATIKSDTELEDIPVIVLTMSRDEFDILLSYNLKADNYITKPVDVARLRELLEAELESDS